MKSLKTILFSAIAVSLLATAGMSYDEDSSNPIRGQKIYQTYVYKVCGITCGDMARKYTMDQWHKFNQDGKVYDVLTDECPMMEKLTKKELQLIYGYMYTHAKDSGVVAPCLD